MLDGLKVFLAHKCGRLGVSAKMSTMCHEKAGNKLITLREL